MELQQPASVVFKSENPPLRWFEAHGLEFPSVWCVVFETVNQLLLAHFLHLRLESVGCEPGHGRFIAPASRAPFPYEDVLSVLFLALARVALWVGATHRGFIASDSPTEFFAQHPC